MANSSISRGMYVRYLSSLGICIYRQQTYATLFYFRAPSVIIDGSTKKLLSVVCSPIMVGLNFQFG